MTEWLVLLTVSFAVLGVLAWLEERVLPSWWTR